VWLSKVGSTDGQAVELDVDEVSSGVTGLAADGDVGTAGLLDWYAENRHAQAVQAKKAV
jgi:hypothetical protein